VSEADDDGALGLGQSATLFIALQEVWKSAKEISTKLAPFILAKPEMELIMEGPGGKVSIKLKKCFRKTPHGNRRKGDESGEVGENVEKTKE
jgi:hypothetical protein